MSGMSAYAAVAEPHRRQILDLLRHGERPAGELVKRLELSCGPSLTVRMLASLMVRIPGMWNGPTGGAGGAVWSAV